MTQFWLCEISPVVGVRQDAVLFPRFRKWDLLLLVETMYDINLDKLDKTKVITFYLFLIFPRNLYFAPMLNLIKKFPLDDLIGHT